MLNYPDKHFLYDTIKILEARERERINYANILNRYNQQNTNDILQIEKVIFDGPATIVFWSDGDKTVVKCQEGDVFDAEKGLAMACSKKLFGNTGRYFNEIKRFIPKELEEESELSGMMKKLIDHSLIKLTKDN